MSGTNHNMNGIRIETRVLAPPGGFSSISFGSGQATGDIYRGHDFNPKTNKVRNFGSNKQVSKSPRVEKASINNKSSVSRRGGGQTVKPPLDNLRTNLRRAADVREQSEKENKMKGYANRERRDSLDELIENPNTRKPSSSSSSSGGGRAIPGLEGYGDNSSRNHIVRAISPIDTKAHGRNRGQQQINKSDYAEILRQQIAEKKSLTDDDGFERSHRGQQGGGKGGGSSMAHRAYPQYEYQSQEKQQQQLQPNRRRGPSTYQDWHQGGEHAAAPSSRRSQYGSGGGQSSISLSWE